MQAGAAAALRHAPVESCATPFRACGVVAGRSTHTAESGTSSSTHHMQKRRRVTLNDPVGDRPLTQGRGHAASGDSNGNVLPEGWAEPKDGSKAGSDVELDNLGMLGPGVAPRQRGMGEDPPELCK